MKKFTKTLALTGALLCTSVGLVACGSGGALVDTSGTYTPSSVSATSTYLDQLDEVTPTANGSYKIKMKMDATVGDAKGWVSIDGHFGEGGDYDITMKITEAGESMSMSVIYDVTDKAVYTDTSMKGVSIKTKTPIATEGDEFDDLDDYFQVSGMSSPAKLKESIEKTLEKFNVEVAETDSYLKVKYVGTGDAEGGTFYIVFDKVDDGLVFSGAKVTYNISSDEGTTNASFEIVSSTESVKTLTESQKAEYLSM